MAFNAYEYVKKIYDSKVGWHTADKAGDRKKADEYAKNAQQYYQQLRNNGYNDVADALQNTNDVGASYIVKDFLKNNSAPVDTVKATTPTKTDTSTITGKTNDVYNTQKSDRETMAKKYDTLEGYNYNHDPYESKIGKSIMENYKFQGKTASDNEVASVGASNGGNIDSYAAANANRQQLAFTNAGNQAILNDFNARINNARGILKDLGVYQQDQDKGMQTTIGMQQNEEQRVFENEETKKNNDVSRKVSISDVTGYVPADWANTGNFYLDENGKLKPEYENIDFSAIMAEAKKNGNTELYNQASVARAAKIYGNYEKYGKYDDGNYTLTGKQQTESGRQFDKNSELTNKEIETNADLTREEIEANKSINDAKNTTNLTIAQMEALAKEAQNAETFENFVSGINLTSNDYGTQVFINKVLKEYWEQDSDVVLESTDVDETGKVIKYPKGKLPLKTLLLDNAKKYGITAEGAKAISSAFDYSPTWVDNYDVWYNPKKDDSSIYE
jgi:hypothetical protein